MISTLAPPLQILQRRVEYDLILDDLHVGEPVVSTMDLPATFVGEGATGVRTDLLGQRPDFRVGVGEHVGWYRPGAVPLLQNRLQHGPILSGGGGLVDVVDLSKRAGGLALKLPVDLIGDRVCVDGLATLGAEPYEGGLRFGFSVCEDFGWDVCGAVCHRHMMRPGSQTSSRVGGPMFAMCAGQGIGLSPGGECA